MVELRPTPNFTSFKLQGQHVNLASVLHISPIDVYPINIGFQRSEPCYGFTIHFTERSAYDTRTHTYPTLLEAKVHHVLLTGEYEDYLNNVARTR